MQISIYPLFWMTLRNIQNSGVKKLGANDVRFRNEFGMTVNKFKSKNSKKGGASTGGSE
ncbi:hypothetical protein [Sphingobacterium hungaricum]